MKLLMRNLFCGLTVCVLSGLFISGCSYLNADLPKGDGTPNDVFVSCQGKDSNPGTQSRPFKTVGAALKAVRGRSGVTIWLMGGIYNEDTLNLSTENSGQANAPLTIRAVDGEKVVFSRGTDISCNRFEKVTEKNLAARLAPAARGKVYSASLAGTALVDKFPYRPDDLKKEAYALVTWNGFTLQQAQWPNRGYDYFAKVLDKGPTTRWLRTDEKPAAYSWDNPTGGTFTVHGKLDFDMLKKELDRTGDISVYGYLNNDWFFQKENLGAVDVKRKALQLLRYTRYGIGNEKLPMDRRFRLINVLCQLDEPGEWYYDQKDQRFYVWPVQPLTDDMPISIAGGEPFIVGRGVNYVVLRDIIFENFGTCGVDFEGCDHILVGGCEFRNGIDIGLKLVDGMYNTITGCDFHDMERAFLLLGRYPRNVEYKSPYKNDINYEYNKVTFSENRRNLIPEHNVADNNHIHHCRLRGYGLAAIGGVGAKFTHNLVHDLNGGIMYGHNDLLAEYNEFYDVGYEMGDWNVCYCGADLSLYNNLFRFNFAHHFMETPRGHPESAWRADDGASGLKTFGNIYYKCGRSAVQGGGPDSTIENSVAYKTRYLWWTVQRPYHEITQEEFLAQKSKERITVNEEIAAGIRSIYDKLNIIGRAEQVFGREGWKTNQVWLKHYPELAKIFGNDFMDKDCNPWGQSCDVIRANYCDYPSDQAFHIHGRNKMSSFAVQKAFLPGSATFEPPAKLDAKAMFVDADKMDFRMRKDFQPMDGFVEIPFEKIGLYLNEFRHTMPDKNQYRMAVRNKYRGVPSSGGSYDLDKINQRYSDPPYMKLAQ